MRKIRVLHCLETIASGGVEQTLLTLIKGLDKNRFDHKIICTWQGGPVAEALNSEEVEVIAIGSFKSPFEFRKLCKVVQIVKKYKPDIIHGAVFEGMTMATVGGFFGKDPVIILEETSDPQNRSGKANWLLRQYAKFGDAFQAISHDVGEYLKNVTKIDPNLVYVIPNGLPMPSFVSEEVLRKTRFSLSLAPDDLVIGFVGRLYDDHKRVSDLIKAISLLNVPNVKLLIVGEGKDRKVLEKQVENLNLEKTVIFLGYHSKPDLFYQLMDIFCIPSSREGFGLVAVEAMLHKLPVIARAVGGLKDIVIDGKTGYLVKPKSHKDLADKINELVHDSQLRVTFGEAGYVRAKEKFTADRYCLEVENLYNTLLKKKGFLH
ncbi:glycosyltransferase [Cyclobacterium sp. SYSU L10401]|uniref:glycosyltransferase n=1 Tax=Cyclobacterium sp. SYSU L10401 TaxID=2678657 RepID=UPI0013D8267E|nr:glycosyltransferase [Cyclobacterium sp. SYSU L10401]